MRSLKTLGILSVLLLATPLALATHEPNNLRYVRTVDGIVCVNPASAASSYLASACILSAPAADVTVGLLVMRDGGIRSDFSWSLVDANGAACGASGTGFGDLAVTVTATCHHIAVVPTGALTVSGFMRVY